MRNSRLRWRNSGAACSSMRRSSARRAPSSAASCACCSAGTCASSRSSCAKNGWAGACLPFLAAACNSFWRKSFICTPRRLGASGGACSAAKKSAALRQRGGQLVGIVGGFQVGRRRCQQRADVVGLLLPERLGGGEQSFDLFRRAVRLHRLRPQGARGRLGQVAGQARRSPAASPCIPAGRRRSVSSSGACRCRAARSRAPLPAGSALFVRHQLVRNEHASSEQRIGQARWRKAVDGEDRPPGRMPAAPGPATAPCVARLAIRASATLASQRRHEQVAAGRRCLAEGQGLGGTARIRSRSSAVAALVNVTTRICSTPSFTLERPRSTGNC